MGTEQGSRRILAMGRILDVCVSIDAMAVSTYGIMSGIARNPELRATFAAMQAEENEHVAWWTGLRERLEEGEFVVPWDDVDELADHLESVLAEIGESIPQTLDDLDDRDLLLVATKMEYFALEPAITQLADFIQGADQPPREQYDEHLERLMLAIERGSASEDRLSAFLVRVLRRAWRNSDVVAGMAMHDALTGLLNRRALGVFLSQVLNAALRHGQSVALLMADVDDFKSVNDRFGHETGDAVLRMVSEAIGRTVRDSDLAARFGGDEFVIVAPETGPGAALTLAERLEAHVRSSVLRRDGRDVGATLSIGVAVFDGAAGHAPSADALLSQADHRLYSAKAAGKARIAEATKVVE